MRKKFGETNGLKASGKMQGIGSDPNYGSSGGGGTSNVNEGLSTAFTFMTSLVDQVSKTTQDLLQKPASKGDEKSSSSGDRAASSRGEQPPDPWASIASNAVSFWKQATEATSDIVNIITKPVDEEEEFKFPRPEGYSTAGASRASSTSDGSTQNVQSVSTSSPMRQQQSSGSSDSLTSHQPRNPSTGSLRSNPSTTESWDNMDDDLQQDRSSSGHTGNGPYTATETIPRNSSRGDGFSVSTTGTDLHRCT